MVLWIDGDYKDEIKFAEENSRLKFNSSNEEHD